MQFRCPLLCSLMPVEPRDQALMLCLTKMPALLHCFPTCHCRTTFTELNGALHKSPGRAKCGLRADSYSTRDPLIIGQVLSEDRRIFLLSASAWMAHTLRHLNPLGVSHASGSRLSINVPVGCRMKRGAGDFHSEGARHKCSASATGAAASRRTDG